MAERKIYEQRPEICIWQPEYRKEYRMKGEVIQDKFIFRNIRQEEAEQAAKIEEICFPPNEACTARAMKERIECAADLFLVAVDKETGKIAGFINGLATEEEVFRDAFFENARLHDPSGENIMLLGVDVLPAYRRRGLAKEMMFQYLWKEQQRGRRKVILTCLEEKVDMYKKMGFGNQKIANSSWGGEQWYEMSCVLK